MKSRTLARVALASVLVTAALAARAQDNIQALADRWAEAYNKHDRDALGGLYTQGAHLMMHGSTTIVGHDAIEEFWAGDFEEGNPLTLLTVTHSVEGSDMMLVHGDYRVVSRDDGTELGGGRFAHLWTRASTGPWLLDRDLWNEPFDPYVPGATDNQVQTLADRWVQAYNKHDREALTAVYTDNARLMMHGAPTIAGRADIGAFWAEDFEAGSPLTLLDVTHAVEGIDMILVHGNYQVIDRTDGSKVGLGRFAHIWTRAPSGQWRLDRDLWRELSEPAR
jgi:uncharacterized protein (TIGR02246 family)